MPRSHPRSHRALTFRALRTVLVGPIVFSLACIDENDAPLNPNAVTIEAFETSYDQRPGAVTGLIPNTAQLVRMAADTTRCLVVSPTLTSNGRPIIVGPCSGGPNGLLKFTSAGEIRTTANLCVGTPGDTERAGLPIVARPCNGKGNTRWAYDAAQRLALRAGGCATLPGTGLQPGVNPLLRGCVSPAPWSQKVLWTTPGGPVVTPPPSPTVKSVRVSPGSNALIKGDSVRLTPTAYNASGQPVPATFTWRVASGGGVASVSPQGLVKGLTVGTATIAAQAAGFTGTATVTVTAPPTTPPPPPPPSPSPPPSGSVPSTPPTLPLANVNVSWRAPTGQTITVGSGGNLQGALNQAQRGDEIVLQAGATFNGNFVLPAKPGSSANGWITVRTSNLGSLPPLGSRVSTSHAAQMPKLVTPNVAPALATAAGASGWRIVGIEVTVVPALTWIQYGLVTLGDGSAAQNQLSKVPHDLILDRVYIHGQPSTNLQRCVALNSASTAIVDSQLLECHGRGFDSQAIGGWNGPGPYLIQNNRLEAAGEIVMFGGSDPPIPNLTPSDITIRRNYLYRPMNWKGLWTVKNLFELKNAQRVLLEGNVMENNWVDGQVGFAVLLGSVNQNGQCGWCIVQDVTLRYNHIHNSAGGFNLLERCGRTAPGGSYGCPQGGQPTRRVALHHNLLTSIGSGSLGTNGRMFQFVDGPEDIWIEHNTGFSPTTYMVFSQFTKYKYRFTYRNNIGGGAQYNLHSSEGLGAAALAKHLSVPYTFAGNVFVGSSSGMPTSNNYAATQFALGFVSALPLGGTWSLLSSSPFFRVGTGGVTPGVNWAMLSSLTANVRQ